MDGTQPIPVGSLLICNGCSLGHPADGLIWDQVYDCDCGLQIEVEPNNIVAPNASFEAPNSSGLPTGEYAIVEMFGHVKLVGRMAETERFGGKFLALEPIFMGKLLPPMMIGAASIYCLTPCSAEIALANGAKTEWGLPDALRSTIPVAMLPAPDFAPRFLDDSVDDDEPNF